MSRVDLEHELTLATIDKSRYWFGKSITPLEVLKCMWVLACMYSS